MFKKPRFYEQRGKSGIKMLPLYRNHPRRIQVSRQLPHLREVQLPKGTRGGRPLSLTLPLLWVQILRTLGLHSEPQTPSPIILSHNVTTEVFLQLIGQGLVCIITRTERKCSSPEQILSAYFIRMIMRKYSKV